VQYISFFSECSKRKPKKQKVENVTETFEAGDIHTQLVMLERDMQYAAEKLDFQKAIRLREQ